MKSQLTNIDQIFTNIKTSIDNKLDLHNKLVGLKISVRNSYIGASHSAPIGEHTNFARPKSYAAMTGHIWMRFTHEQEGFWTTNIFNGLPYHLGTGGGGDYDSPWTKVNKLYFERFGRNDFHQMSKGKTLYRPVLYHYTFTFWLDDFPNFKKGEEQRKMLTDIAGTTPDKPKPIELIWNDLETEIIDDEFRWDIKTQIADRKQYTTLGSGI